MANSLVTNRNKASKKASKKASPADAKPETGPRGVKVADGETAGYRDGPEDTIETRNFADGWLPDGWVDTPEKCENARDENGLRRDHIKV